MGRMGIDGGAWREPTRFSYPDASLRGDAVTEVLLIEPPDPFALDLRTWHKRDPRPMAAVESAALDRLNGHTLASAALLPERARVRSVKQTFYDRRHGHFGAIRVRLLIEDTDAQQTFVELVGPDTHSMSCLRDLMPRLEELASPGAALQVSVANQADVPGNFALLPSGTRDWELHAACDEPWWEREQHALVELADGRRAPARVVLRGDRSTNAVREVFVRPLVPGALPDELDPAAARFVLVAQTLLWDDLAAVDALRGDYTARSDLRHVLRFPFVGDRILFYDELVRDPAALSSALDGRPVDLALAGAVKAVIAPEELAAMLVEIYGYARRTTSREVRRPGDFHLTSDALRLCFLSARYPLNALAVTADGRRLAFVCATGMSGRLGVDYWTFGEWLSARLGWRPAALFALDNGLDPSWIAIDGEERRVLVRGRERLGAALNVLPPDRRG
jgi:hypothetical protein